jgi:hypothetical protein
MAITTHREKWQSAVEAAALQLVTVDVRSTGAFIRTPLLYPSGATVVVRVEPLNGHFFVSDIGLGYQEAELMGTTTSFTRHARLIADESGIRFDSHAFFVATATSEQLSGVVATVANCSHEAVAYAAFRLFDRKVADEAEVLFERLARVFSSDSIQRNAELRGASQTEWSVASVVRIGSHVTVFEPVLNHRNSVASVATKFHDIALLENAPERVAVVRKKDDLGTLLGVLAQAGSVINRDAPDSTLRRLARAA